MPTALDTMKPLLDLSCTPAKIPMLYFNRDGQIDICLFDDTSGMRQLLGLDEKKHIPLDTIIKANILCTVAEKSGLTLGMTLEEDQQIIQVLTSLFSPNVRNQDRIIKEIIAAWKEIANHPLSDGFIAENKGTIFTRHLSYEAIRTEYLATFIQTLSVLENIKQQSQLLAQVGELMYSTMEGKPIAHNPEIKINNLKKIARMVIQHYPKASKQIEQVMSQVMEQNGQWFIDIQALGFPVQSAIEELDDLEPESKIEKTKNLKIALENIIFKKAMLAPHHDSDIELDLKEVCDFFQAPERSSYYIKHQAHIHSLDAFTDAVIHFMIELTKNTQIDLSPPGITIENISTLDEKEKISFLDKLYHQPEFLIESEINCIFNRAQADAKKHELLIDAINEFRQFNRSSKRQRVSDVAHRAQAQEAVPQAARSAAAAQEAGQAQRAPRNSLSFSDIHSRSGAQAAQAQPRPDLWHFVDIIGRASAAAADADPHNADLREALRRSLLDQQTIGVKRKPG